MALGPVSQKVSKHFGSILGDISPSVSSKGKLLKAEIFEKSFFSGLDCSLKTSFSGPKTFRDFWETGPSWSLRFSFPDGFFISLYLPSNAHA